MQNVLVTREPIRLAYVRSNYGLVDASGGVIDAAEAAKEYGEMWVISAWNPLGESLSPSDNAARHRSLIADVVAAEIASLPAAERLPRADWVGNSLAVFGIKRRAATQLGRTHGQHAVVHITATSQSVYGCLSRWERTRPTGDSDWAPEPYGDKTLADAILEAFDIDITCEFHRFRRPGWRLDGDTLLPCDICGTDLDLFSGLFEAKNGTWYDAKAILCQGCSAVRLPSHLPASLRLAVYEWSDWHLSAQDALLRPDGNGRNCYIAELRDTSGRQPKTGREWVYVGETSKDVEERLLEHLAGVRKSRRVHDYGTGELRRDLMECLPTHWSQAESRAYERYLATKLRLLGYEVEGGH